MASDHFDKLWVPDLFFTNEKSGSFHDVTTPNRLLHVSPSGEILYSVRWVDIVNINSLHPLYLQNDDILMESSYYMVLPLFKVSYICKTCLDNHECMLSWFDTYLLVFCLLYTPNIYIFQIVYHPYL